MTEETKTCACCNKIINVWHTVKFAATVTDQKTGKEETMNFCANCGVDIMHKILSEGL